MSFNVEEFIDRNRSNEPVDTVEEPSQSLLYPAQQQAINAFTQGLAQTFTSIPKDISVGAYTMGLSGETPEDDVLYQLGERADNWVRQNFPTDPNQQKNFLTSALPHAFGNMLGFIGGGAAGKALKIPRAVTIGGLGSALEGVGQYEEARAFGTEDPETLKKAYLWGKVIGATELIPIERMLNRVNRASGGMLKRHLINHGLAGVEEFIQEFGQTTAGNAVARELYDEDRALFEGAGLGGSAGGTSAFITSVLAGAIQSRFRRRGRDLNQFANEAMPEDVAAVDREVSTQAEGVIQFGLGADRRPQEETIRDLPRVAYDFTYGEGSFEDSNKPSDLTEEEIEIGQRGRSDPSGAEIDAVFEIEDQDALLKIVKEHPDPFVQSVAAGRLKNPDFLANLVYGDQRSENSSVRVSAIHKIRDQDLLAKVAFGKEKDDIVGVREAAVKHINDKTLLATIAHGTMSDENWRVREAAVKGITDQDLLFNINKTDVEKEVRKTAVKSITDSSHLFNIVKTDDPHDRNWAVKMIAVDKITDREMLLSIAQDEQIPPEVRQIASRRINPPNQPDVAAPFSEQNYADREGVDPEKARQAQKKAFDNIDQVSNHPLPVAKTGAKETRAGINILGVAIKRELAKQGRIDLRGRKVSGPDDVGVMALGVFRNPAMEVFRIVYVREGEVVGHESITSRLPDTAVPFTKEIPREVDSMRRRAERLQADKIYLVHNHPTGNSKPSRDDATMTKMLAPEIEDLFGAHIVINHGEYSVIEKDRISALRKKLPEAEEVDPQLSEPDIPHPLLGKRFKNPADIASYAKEINLPSNRITLFGIDSSFQIKGIADMPVAMLRNIKGTTDHLRGLGRDFGGRLIGVYVGDEELAKKMESLIAVDVLHDAISTDPDGSYQSHAMDKGQGIQVDKLGRPVYRWGRPIKEEEQSIRVEAPDTLYGEDPEDIQRRLNDAMKEPSSIRTPNLSTLGTEGEARTLLDVLDQLREEAGEPPRKSDTVLATEALAELTGDYQGARSRIMASRTLNDRDTIIAKEMLRKEGLSAMRSGDTQKIYEATVLADKIRQTGTEAARAFRARRADVVGAPSEQLETFLNEALFEIPSETRKRMENMDDPSREAVLRRHAEDMKKVKEDLAAQGIDLDALKPIDFQGREGQKKIAQIVRATQSAKADTGSKIYEYWINAILSNPATQTANLMGNSFFSASEFTAQRFTEAALNVFARDPKSAKFGEFKHMMRAGIMAVGKAVRNFHAAWDTELPVFANELGRGTQKIEVGDRGPHIGGRLGRTVRVPVRLLLAVDEFSKTLVGNMEAAAMAYRLATEEGKSGSQLDARVAELIQDPFSPAWDFGLKRATELTFQEPLGTLGKGVLSLRRSFEPAHYLVPFVTTVGNIFKVGIRKSPAGTLRLLYKIAKEGGVRLSRDGKGTQYTVSDFVYDGSEQILGWLLSWGIYTMVFGGDDDRPLITGTSSKSKSERDLQYRTAPPASVRIGDKYVSYARIEPLSTTLAPMVDIFEAMKDVQNGQEFVDLFGRVFHGFIGAAKDKTFMRGIGDLIKAMEDEKHAATWASNFATSWVPNIIRASARNADPVFRDVSFSGSKEGWWVRAGGKTAHKALPFPTELAPPPKVDIWGREITKDSFGKPGTDWVYRMMVPIRISDTEDTVRYDRMLLNWNNQNPADVKFFHYPKRYFTVDGERRDMSDEEYHNYLVRSGQLALYMLQYEQVNVENPAKEDVDKVGKIMRKSRKQAKQELFGIGGSHRLALGQLLQLPSSDFQLPRLGL